MNFSIKDIRSNPFRDLKRNPLNQEKVDELKASISDTGFWDNVLARLGKDSKPEIAYGHHRIEAARQAGMAEVGLIIRELSDSDMLKIMARENSETYKYCVLALLESVRGAVVALADGRVKPEEMPVAVKTNAQHLRYAPSFLPGVSSPQLGEHPYTAISVATFLGRTKKKGKEADQDTIAALRALHLIELGQMTEKEVAPWSMEELDRQTLAREKGYAARAALEKRKQEEAAAAGKITDAQIKDVQRQQKEAAVKATKEAKDLADAIDKADQDEAKKLAALARERIRKAEVAEKERLKQRKELDAQRKKQQEVEDKAAAAKKEVQRKAAAERVPAPKDQPSVNTYFPHFTQLVAFCDRLWEGDQAQKLFAEVLRDKAHFNEKQKATLSKAWEKAVARGSAALAKL